jgi:CRP-like cAMP-binding protein
MKFGSAQIRIVKGIGPQAGRKGVLSTLRRPGGELKKEGKPAMQRESRIRRMEAVRAHPVAELLECPEPVGLLLNGSVQRLHFRAGEVVFHQSESCRGLYLVVSGRFLRAAEWGQTGITLAPARPGELLELAAVLGDGGHNYTLTAQTAASVLLLPIEALTGAFQSYTPLRMRLLEELAREVSRAYLNCCLSRPVRLRRANARRPERPQRDF